MAGRRQTDPRPNGVEGRMCPRGPLVDEHEFTFYGNTDPSFYRDGRPGITVVCTCTAVHRLSGGHTMSDLIRLQCNEVGVS